MSTNKISDFFINPASYRPTKKVIVFGVGGIILGVASAAIGGLALASLLHHLPASFAPIAPIGTIGMKGAYAMIGAGAGVAAGSSAALILIHFLGSRRKKTENPLIDLNSFFNGSSKTDSAPVTTPSTTQSSTTLTSVPQDTNLFKYISPNPPLTQKSSTEQPIVHETYTPPLTEESSIEEHPKEQPAPFTTYTSPVDQPSPTPRVSMLGYASLIAMHNQGQNSQSNSENVQKNPPQPQKSEEAVDQSNLTPEPPAWAKFYLTTFTKQ